MMEIRARFERELESLRSDVLKMAGMVEDELTLAISALDSLDAGLANQVVALDEKVNAARFEIERDSVILLTTQQPMAGDLRRIVSVMNIVIDLERMGDQAKGIAKVIPHMFQYPEVPQPAELKSMAAKVQTMLHLVIQAFAQDDIELAQQVAARDDEIDELYAQTFRDVIQRMAAIEDAMQIEATYETLRVARELERFGDLATNIAERVVYSLTGTMVETNIDYELVSPEEDEGAA